MVTVELEGFPQVWSDGDRIIELVLSQGQGKRGSGVRCVLADPDYTIAAALIEHTIKSGGIQPLEQPAETPAGSSAGVPAGGASVGDTKNKAQWEDAIVKTCLANGVTDDGQIAYILATAAHETRMGEVLIEQGSRAYFNKYEGRSDLGNNQPGDGYKYRGRGLVQVTGRVHYASWSKRLNKDFIGNPDLMTDPATATLVLVTGIKNGWFTGRKISQYVNGAKQDFYQGRRVVNGMEPKQAADVDKKSREYLAKLPAIKARVGGATPVASAVPVEKTTVAAPEPTAGVVKGNKLTVQWGDVGFEFYHQGTEVLSEGRTELIGLGIGFELSRRQRNKTEGNLSLKQLAEKIAKAHGAELVWSAPTDIMYTHISQSGMSDYKLLERLCSEAGYFLRDEGKKIHVASLANLVDTGMVLIPGLNLISWKMKDQALSDEAESQGSSLVQHEQKVELNPQSGTFEQKKPDLDVAKDKASTGAKQKESPATIAPTSVPVAAVQQSRTKRLKGLPSTFVMPLSQATLGLAPLYTVITEGLPGVLSRIWAIDKVEHNLREGTTTLEVYSPVEVADNTPPSQAVVGQQAPLPPGQGYIWVTNGTVTSTQNEIRSVGTSPHIGIDIAAAQGEPIYAPQDGVVSGFVGSGICVNIKHPDGCTSRLMHMSERYVKIGQPVKRGEMVGRQGATGKVTGVHAHWDLQGLPRDTYRSSGGGVYNYTSAVGLSVPKKGTVIKALTSP